jgi:DNA-directed RNA polymerase subunit RPC12/RpoP
MNPWGFKRLKNKDVAEIQGYIDQISFYMYMLNTPYGSIFVEDKGSNELVEVQIVWRDLHEDVEYAFDPETHGELTDNTVRVVIDNERFFGSEKTVGLVPRITRLWNIKIALEQLDANNAGLDAFTETMPPRCSENPGKFPCSWGDGKEKCEYFEHCWNEFTKGCTVRPFEACPAECIWDVRDYQVDSRKVPASVTIEVLDQLISLGALDVTKFLVDEVPETVPADEAEETAMNIDHIFNANGELHLGVPPVAVIPSETVEYQTDEGKKAIKCTNCGKEITYARLANGGTKKCPFCNHVNKVLK